MTITFEVWHTLRWLLLAITVVDVLAFMTMDDVERRYGVDGNQWLVVLVFLWIAAALPFLIRGMVF